MPCDGIAVATVKCAVPKVMKLLAEPENLQAVAYLLREKGYEARVVNRTLMVNNVVVSIRDTVIIATLPPKVIQDIQQAAEAILGILTQNYLAGILQENLEVTGQTYSNGYLVLQVNL